MLFTCISYILLTRAMLWAVSSSWTAIPSQHQPTLPWNGNTTIHNMTLLFTQLASHPFFSISSTTSVFSLNLKFLSGCANVVLYTFSYSPRAAILPKFYTKQTAASVAFLQMTTCLYLVSFLYTFLYVGTSETELEQSGNFMPGFCAAPLLPAGELRLRAGQQMPNMVQQEQRETHSYFVISLILRRCPSRNAGPRLPETAKWFLFSHFFYLFQELPAHYHPLSSWWKTAGLSAQDCS